MDGVEAKPGPGATVCVTGATGYIGSWLVRSLLRRGYVVHGTARDTGKASRLLSVLGANGRLKIFEANLSREGSFDEAVKGCVGVFHVAASMEFTTSIKENIGKASRLLSVLGANGRLKIFEANLNKEGSFDEAVKGCVGVFHVAASMEFTTSIKENIEDEVRSKILEPAVRGTINLLRACWRAGSVKRVVFTSSISTITAKDARGEWKSVVDESSVTPINVVWTTKPSGWVYVLSKLLTEERAFQFAKEKGMDLVSIVPPTVAGPFLTPSVPASVQVLLSPITGDSKLYPILTAVHSRLGSISLVHVEDICNAHIFLMEQPTAEGRYICAAGSCVMSQLVDLLSLESPSSSAGRVIEEFHDSIPSAICSNRLTDLGFKFQYGIGDIINHSVACCNERSFLKNQAMNDDRV